MHVIIGTISERDYATLDDIYINKCTPSCERGQMENHAPFYLPGMTCLQYRPPIYLTSGIIYPSNTACSSTRTACMHVYVCICMYAGLAGQDIILLIECNERGFVALRLPGSIKCLSAVADIDLYAPAC